MFSFIRFSKTWFVLSGVAVGVSIAAIAFFGLNLGIDFTGGSLLEIHFDEPVTAQQVSAILESSELDLGIPIVTPSGENSFLLRFRYLEEEAEQTQLTDEFSQNIGSFTIERFTAIGPTLGRSLRERAVRALAYAAIAIVIYLAATFRNSRRDSLAKYVAVGGALAFAAVVIETMDISELWRWLVFLLIIFSFLAFLVFEIRHRSSSLKYGVCAIIALAHDIVITLGVFALLGALLGVEINSLTVTALLAIMGFSVNDTIVVFDRLRENRRFQRSDERLADVADRSLRQTLARSINTSASTLIVLVLLLVLGAESIRWFVVALAVGTVVGTYSSIFTATPILVAWENRN